MSKSSGWDTGGPFLAPLISVSSPCRSPLRTGDGAAESLRGCGDRTSTQPPRSPAQYPRTPLSETHSYKHSYKTFECGLFHAGARPPAFLSSKDIFCGQLGDESQREKNGNKVKGGGRTEIRRVSSQHLAKTFGGDSWFVLHAGYFWTRRAERRESRYARGRSARAPAFPKSVTCVEHLCPNPPMIHFTNLDYMGLSDPRTALECLEIVIKGR